MASATSDDVSTLTKRLRGKGLSDAEVAEALRGMGYSRRDAEAAAGITPSRTSQPQPAPAASPAAGGGGGAGGGSSQGATPPGGPSLASLATPDLPSPTLKLPKRLDGGDAAGFAAGLLLYTLALNYLRYGPEGVKGWLRAKFLNQVPGGQPLPGAWGRQTLAPGLTSTRPQIREA